MGYLRERRRALDYAPWEYRPQPNDYGADFEEIISAGFGGSYEDLPVDLVLKALEERGLPPEEMVVSEIVEGTLANAIERARMQGDIDVLAQVLRSTPDFDEDGLEALLDEALTDADGPVDEDAFLSELLAISHRNDDREVERVVSDYADRFTPNEWALTRSRCSGFPAAEWARSRMDHRMGMALA